MPPTVADHSRRSPGARIVAGVGVLFYLVTSAVILAVFAVEAGWARITGKE